MIKIALLTLIVLMLATLGTGLQSLLTQKHPKRLVWILWIRVALGVGLILLLIAGAMTGQLAVTAPWSGRY